MRIFISLALAVVMVCLVIGPIGAVKQITLTRTELTGVNIKIVPYYGDTPPALKHKVFIAITGQVYDSNGNAIESKTITVAVDDLGATKKDQIIELLKMASKKLNKEGIDEDVDTLPDIQILTTKPSGMGLGER